MFSWIFRHRAKLRLIYGPPSAALPSETGFEDCDDFEDFEDFDEEPEVEAEVETASEAPQPEPSPARKPRKSMKSPKAQKGSKTRPRGHPDAGSIERRGSFVLIGPMPKRVE